MFLRYMSVFFLSMVPLLELRGAIPIAVGLGIEPVHAVIVCAIGNLVPVPFIYFFARKFLVWGLDKKYIGGICHFFHDKGQRAGEKLSGKAGKWGLMLALTLFVGIPVPGTGAWTGTLGASFLNMGAKETALSVGVGVALAAVIMINVSLVGAPLFGLSGVLQMSDCLFCKIIAGEIPSTKVYEDELVFAFRDIAPQAPTHILVIPKAHISGCNGVNAENSSVVAHIFEVIPKIAAAEGLTGGYRVVSNCGDDAGQTVHHLHLHILGGTPLNLEMA